MNAPAGTLFTMAWTFALMSLLAIGGANSAIRRCIASRSMCGSG